MARGIDYNIFFGDTLNVGVPIDFRANLTASKLLERSTEFVNPDDSVDRETYQGEWGFPEWQAQLALCFTWDRWTATWETRYLDSVGQDPESDGYAHIERVSEEDIVINAPGHFLVSVNETQVH